MKKEIEKLKKEHEKSKIYLTFMQDALNRMSKNGFNKEDAKLSFDISVSLHSLLNDHFKKEERNIFPAFAENNVIKIKELYCEHNLIRSEADILKNEMRRLDSFQNALTMILIKTKNLQTLVESHFKNENNWFLKLKEDNLVVNN